MIYVGVDDFYSIKSVAVLATLCMSNLLEAFNNEAFHLENFDMSVFHGSKFCKDYTIWN